MIIIINIIMNVINIRPQYERYNATKIDTTRLINGIPYKIIKENTKN